MSADTVVILSTLGRYIIDTLVHLIEVFVKREVTVLPNQWRGTCTGRAWENTGGGRTVARGQPRSQDLFPDLRPSSQGKGPGNEVGQRPEWRE